MLTFRLCVCHTPSIWSACFQTADIVYGNYGTVDDFNLLKNNYSIDLTNKIVLLRYGALYRGNKVGY